MTLWILIRQGNDVIMESKPTTDDIKRSRTMSRIKSKDTSIELALRKALWGAGIRYRKNYAKLPGTPDIAITKYKIAIFCDGEFWHGKDWESKRGNIQSNHDYWIEKIERNIGRDIEVNRVICGNGWTVIRFWGNEILDRVADCVEEIQGIIFQSKIDSHSSNQITCDRYPCWLLRNDDGGNTNESDPLRYDAMDLPCFDSSFGSPCQDP